MEKRQEYSRPTVRARAICGLSNLLLAEYFTKRDLLFEVRPED